MVTGMIVLTFPWHVVGVIDMPRRMAYFGYTNSEIAPQAVTVIRSLINGLMLVILGALFLLVFAARAPQQRHRAARIPLKPGRAFG